MSKLQSFRTPVLPFVLYALWVTFGYSILLAKLLMALLSSFTCVLLAILANRLFDARVGWVVGVLAALCTTFIRWSGTLGAETLALFFLIAGVYLFCFPPAFLSTSGVSLFQG
jgi:energy-converting hydrogenase Eha subunit A